MSLEDELYRDSESVTDHWFLDLIKKPNQSLTWRDIKFLAEWWYQIDGNAYIYTPADPLPFAMHVLPSNKVSIEATNEVPETYVYTYRGGELRIPKEQMIHFKSPYPALDNDFEKVHYKGQAWKFEQALKLMNMEVSKTDFVKSFFDSDGVTPYILSASENLPPEQLKKIKKGFNDAIGNDAYHVQAIVSAGAKVEQLANSNTANSIAEDSADQLVKQLTMLFMTPEKVLNMDFNGKAAAYESIQLLFDTALKPDAFRFQAEIDKWLMNYEEGLNYEIVPYKFEDDKSQREQEKHDLTHGLRTINDILRDRGLEPVNGGDTRYLPLGVMPLDGFENEERSFEKKLHSSYWNLQVKRVDKYEREYEKEIAKELDTIAEEVFENIRTQNNVKKLNITSLFNINNAIERLIKKTDKIVRKLSVSTIVSTLAENDTEYNEDSWLGVLRDASENNSKRIKTSVNSFNDELKQDIQRSLSSTTSPDPQTQYDNLVEDLGDKLDTKYKKSRAKMIARTNANALDNKVRLDTAKQIGFTKKIWVTEQDDRVRPSHQRLHGKVLSLEGEFKVGDTNLSYPSGEADNPKEVVNCRCKIRPSR